MTKPKKESVPGNFFDTGQNKTRPRKPKQEKKGDKK